MNESVVFDFETFNLLYDNDIDVDVSVVSGPGGQSSRV